jgi:hypothetical protein
MLMLIQGQEDQRPAPQQPHSRGPLGTTALVQQPRLLSSRKGVCLARLPTVLYEERSTKEQTFSVARRRRKRNLAIALPLRPRCDTEVAGREMQTVSELC